MEPINFPRKNNINNLPLNVEKRKFGCLRSCLIIFVALIIISGIFGVMQMSAYKSFINSKSTNKETKTFEIKQGETLDKIADRLTKEGLLANKEILGMPAYKIYLKLNNINSANIQAGIHEIPAETSVSQVFNLLRSDNCGEIQVTIKEGLRIEEIAEELDKAFKQAQNEDQNSVIKFDKDNFIKLSKNYTRPDSLILSFELPRNLEGYLFPDTYRFCRNITTEKVIENLLTNFNTKAYLIIEPKLKTQSNYTLDQVVNIAAMLEREARKYDEKQVVAGIILKRLSVGIPLGIDATSQYEFGYSETQKTWWRKGYELDQIIDTVHRYSTRKNVGLPPTPIANPGTEALKAVLEPKFTDNIFYITGNDGKMYYAKTDADHQLNICRYIYETCK